MLNDVPSEEKDKPCNNTPEFLPFSWSVLTKSLTEYAEKHLNETEETRTKALQVVREFMKNELDYHDEVEDCILLWFLRTKKYDVKKACQLLRTGTEFLDSYHHLFYIILHAMDVEVVKKVVESKTVGFLPYRDSKGRAIVFIRAECWNPSEIKAEDLVFGTIVAFNCVVENPVNQVAGFVVILDFKNLSVRQVLAMSPWTNFGIQALQSILPCRVSEFHVTHTPGIFRAVWKLVKPLISEKIRNRIIFYKSTNWESLHRRIPPEILPEELGGKLGPYSPEHWASDMKANKEKFYARLMMAKERYDAKQSQLGRS